jgi:DNA processing protein
VLQAHLRTARATAHHFLRFALGIDIITHDQALKSQLSTIACMAHDLDRTYPPEHQDYIEKILEQGAFVSDFTTAEKFDRKNFLIRNRLIAGLSHTTVVVQSLLEGGSMMTAHFAHQYQRELFAFPGAVTDRLHQGCNALIHSQ